jgi:hypothetical protein
MTDVGDEIKYDTGPKLLQTEESMGLLLCQVEGQPDGKQSLFFGGTWLRSLPEVLFGLSLNQRPRKKRRRRWLN